MKKILISSIVFPILILTAGACAPTPTATIAPSETPTLVPTLTQTLTPTETPAPTTVAPLEESILNQEIIPFAELDYLLSESYAADIIKRDLNNELPQFSEKALSIHPKTIIRNYKNKDSLMYTNNGFNTIFDLTDSRKYYTDPESEGWLTVDIKESRIGDTPVLRSV